jgi:hypothetical protein
MSPYISGLLAKEQHRDLLLEADSTRLARAAVESRAARTARSVPTEVGPGGQRGTRTLDLADVNRAL